MTNYYGKQELTLRDAKGHIGKIHFFYSFDPSAAVDWLAAAGGVGAILTALEAMSHLAVVGVGGLNSTGYDPNQYGSTTGYFQAETKARIVYQVENAGFTTVKNITRFEIPGPVDGLFYADKETINPTATLVAALTTALQTVDAHNGQAVTRTGLIFGPCLGGKLIRRKVQRKLTLYSKSPNLDEQEDP